MRRHIFVIFVTTSELAFTRNTSNFTAHIYFHLDNFTRWKQYRSVSLEQICDLQTVKLQEILIKVCAIFYNMGICYWGCGEKTKFSCNHLIQKQPPEVFFVEKCSQIFCKIHRKAPVPGSSFVSYRSDACNFIKKKDSDKGVFQWILPIF